MPLAQHRPNSGDVPAYLPYSAGVLELAVCPLEAQIKTLSPEGIDLLGQLVVGPRPEIGGLH